MKATPSPSVPPPSEEPIAVPSAEVGTSGVAIGVEVPGIESAGSASSLIPPSSGVSTAVWPEWHRVIDVAVGVIVVVTAFLVASFTARNADFFRHIASGRLLAHGDYLFGKDPHSFTAADRLWVNQNWLFDLAYFAIYSVDPTGTVAVVVKALAFAAAIGLIFRLRRTSDVSESALGAQSLWPWVLLTGLATVSIAGHTSLRPSTFGFLYFIGTLVLLLRTRTATRPSRTHLWVGGVICLWTNTDSSAFLGPILVAVVLLGELFQTKFLHRDDAPDPAFFDPPSTQVLTRSLLASVVGFLLNPSFIVALVSDPVEAFTQLLPFELASKPAGLVNDPQLSWLAVSALDARYLTNPQFGYNLSGLTTLVLLAFAVVALTFGYSRLRASHVLLWFVFGALAARHFRYLPYFLLVMVPLVAAHLNGLFGRLRLGSAQDQRTRMLLTGAGVGRILTITLAIIMLGATIPGYLHAPSPNPVYARRVAWMVDADAGLASGVSQLQTWRADGSLPASIHGVTVQPDFTDYAAWFAPSEKVWLNSRYRLHRAELADMLTLRAELSAKPTDARSADSRSRSVTAVLDRASAAYVCVGQVQTRLEALLLQNLWRELTTSDVEPLPFLVLNGRAAVLGRSDSPEVRAVTSPLRMRVARSTFGPLGESVPGTQALRPPEKPPEGWLADYLARPQPGSSQTDDSVFLSLYADILEKQQELLRQQNGERRAMASGAIAGASLMPQVFAGAAVRRITDEEWALPIAAARAARRGIAASPDNPDSFHALALAYSNVRMPESLAGENAIQELTAITRFLARCPIGPRLATDDRTARMLAPEVVRMAFRGASMLLRPNQMLPPNVLPPYHPRAGYALPALDAASHLLAVAQDYLPFCKEPQTMPPRESLIDVKVRVMLVGRPPNSQLPMDEDFQVLNKGPSDARYMQVAAKIIRQLAELNDKMKTQQLGRLGPMTLANKFRALDVGGLPAEAIELTKKEFREIRNRASARMDLGIHPFLLYAEVIELEMLLGQIETAASDLRELEEESRMMTDESIATAVRDRVKRLDGMRARLEGDFGLAARIVEEQARNRLPRVADRDLALLDSAITARRGLVGAVAGPAIDWSVRERTGRALGGLVDQAQYHTQHGILALMEGNNATAAEDFAKALRPQGVDLASTFSRLAKWYDPAFLAAFPYDDEAEGLYRLRLETVRPILDSATLYSSLLKKYAGNPKTP